MDRGDRRTVYTHKGRAFELNDRSFLMNITIKVREKEKSFGCSSHPAFNYRPKESGPQAEAPSYRWRFTFLHHL